ncbi:MAG: DUF4129 domain-containing protein [Acidimicrobiia bacterium]
MSRQRRYVSVVLGLVTLLSLGFVVAVAARSRPGGFRDDPLFELDTNFDINLGQLIGWILIVLSVLGAIILVFAIKEVRPRRQERKRSYAGVILGVLVFLLILRFFQPVAESFVAEPAAAGEVGTTGDPATTGGGAAAWLFSLLVAAVIAAALTRVGLAIRVADSPFAEPPPEPASPRPPADRGISPALIDLGTEPRARVLDAYLRFEQCAGGRGVVRRATETAQRHARRVTTEFDLDRASVSKLMARYSRTRFGHGPVSVGDAEEAEAASGRLCHEMEAGR